MLLNGITPVQVNSGNAKQPNAPLPKESALNGLQNSQNNGVIDKNTGLDSKKMVHQSDNGQNSQLVRNNRERSYICKTCERRAYQDASNDPGVSMKSPTKISPQNAASAVMGHESEHVNREQAKATSENRKVVYQSVQLHNAICPECGRTYVSGGTTTTVTKAQEKVETENRDNNAPLLSSHQEEK